MCAPFQIYKNVHLPKPPAITQMPSLGSSERNSDWEKTLVAKIALQKGHEHFQKIYLNWKNENQNLLSELQRFHWLQCVWHYIQQDLDNDGTPDWIAIVDGKPSQVLIPFDDDIDGDGIENVLDSDPLDKSKRNVLVKGVIPKHLRSKSKEVIKYQTTLYEEYGILALDHTDTHSPKVLNALLVLLNQGFSKEFIKNLKSFKYFYAFRGHDSEKDIAAYHQQARALSIGGIFSYDEEDKVQDDNEFVYDQKRVLLVAALAHEIGHVFLLDQLGAHELRKVCEKYGSWNEVFKQDSMESLFAEPFFRNYTLNQSSEKRQLSADELRNNNFVSQYAFTNAHEWFADAFAGTILTRLGLKQHLGHQWREMLVKKTKHKREYWANYNNVSEPFMSWLTQRMEKIQ
ncbi:MAG: hypothetical protein SGI74_04910 [Oligoflexia bacterium]|nr:hypothetical protein [Oligoflexia bacterium]